MMNQPSKPNSGQKEVDGAVEGLQSAGEDLGYSLTPESVNTQPTPQDLLNAAAAYTLSKVGTGANISNFQKTSEKPEIWEGTVTRGNTTKTITGKRVPGGYKFSVQ
jgi:hypothetical protein